VAKKEKSPPTAPVPPEADKGIGYLSVAGFKSILNEQSIEIRPLTLLAGANSSGKSSIMQGLLLMKQTLEAGYDPGALLLNGANVKFTSADQILARGPAGENAPGLVFGVGLSRSLSRTVFYRRQEGRGFEISLMEVRDRSGVSKLAPGPLRIKSDPDLSDDVRTVLGDMMGEISGWQVNRNRCFLEVWPSYDTHGAMPIDGLLLVSESPEMKIRRTIHLPGLRGNPERAYPVTAVGESFPGTFENYSASVIAQWQSAQEEEKLLQLGRNLEKLGLTWRVSAQFINDTQVELRLGRLPHGKGGGKEDMVNIADVGFGASQSLPVLVALLTAKPGQLVYLEQPELHLHPRAQLALAEVLADAARRGVKVVAETHSDLLILAVQSLVAEGKLAPELVKLHWFQRNAEGVTEIFSADLDENGAYGDWPEDFADVRLRSEDRYLDAVHLRSAGR
jgi:predicted ATPase